MDRSSLLHNLREQVDQAIDRTMPHTWKTLTSGNPALDAILPAGGLRCGTLVEWLADEPGFGATRCAFRAAQSAMAGDRPLVIVDGDDTFYPPGMFEFVDRRRVLLVRCNDRRQLEWVTDQSLRTSGVGAVLVRYDVEDERRLRRWQLAAESSGALGLIVRQLPRQPEACFSDVRIGVTPKAGGEGRPVRLELLRSRQGGRGAVIDVRLDDDAHSLSSNPTASACSAPSRAGPPLRTARRRRAAGS